jgi:hypothetical protein
MIFLVEVLCIKKPVKETIHGLVLLFYPHRQFLSLHKFYIFQFSYLIVMTNTKSNRHLFHQLVYQLILLKLDAISIVEIDSQMLKEINIYSNNRKKKKKKKGN